MIVVIKHDGRKELFDPMKINAAVCRAAKSIDVAPPHLNIRFKEGEELPVDVIHDRVEKELMKVAPDVAKAYILYREKRTQIRESNSKLMRQVGTLVKEMNHNNANTGNSAASKMYGIAEATSKPYFLAHMNKKWAENHRKCRLYLHDLGYRELTFNCFFSPLGKMLENGFDNGVGFIRPPKRIGSALALTAIILQSMQNDMFGGQGIAHFDTDLAPYVAKEHEYWLKTFNGNKKAAKEYTENAVYQAMEAFVYNMNTMRSRSGAQVTFSSVNFGLDTSPEARCISKNLLKAYIAGLGHGENPIFPNLCYRLSDGINLNKGEPNFDLTELAIECLGKRIQPRFVFCDSPAYPNKWDASTMGCRTAVRDNINGDSAVDARGNLAFSTINLPLLALEAKGDIDKFYELYDEIIQDGIDELIDRYNTIKNLKVKDIPFVGQWYQGHEGLAPEDSIEPMVKNGSLSVGFIGLAECLIALTGKHHGESDESQMLGLEIVGRLRKRMDEAKEKYHLNFAAFATPAESLCYTALKAIREQFGIIPRISDKEYLTNSCHLPVSFECDMKTKVDIEAPYHLLCNAGAIFYIEAPSSPKFNPKGVLKALQYISKSGIVFGGLNFEHDFCADCGHQGTFTTCPKCGSKNVRVTKIITGYLSTVERFNAGKQAEARDRVSHV